MAYIDRRSFIKTSGVATAGALVGSQVLGQPQKRNNPNDTVHVTVIGIRSRGKDHYRALSKIPNVKIVTLCDIDQRLLPEADTYLGKAYRSPYDLPEVV